MMHDQKPTGMDVEQVRTTPGATRRQFIGNGGKLAFVAPAVIALKVNVASAKDVGHGSGIRGGSGSGSRGHGSHGHGSHGHGGSGSGSRWWDWGGGWY